MLPSAGVTMCSTSGTRFCCALAALLTLPLGCGSPRQASTAEGGEPTAAPTLAAPTSRAAERPELRYLPETHTDFVLTVSREDAAREPAFRRELDAPVFAIALDRTPHVSALTERSVFIHDAKGWRQEPLPRAALQGEGGLQLQLFYGRDYRVRLIGDRRREKGWASVYFRWLPGGFRAAPDELGRLGSRPGRLLAVLGTEDPEVVCRPGDVCLVKRLSGWKAIPAPDDLELCAIDGGGAWAIGSSTLYQLEADKRWKATGGSGPWNKASALSVVDGEVWVAEREGDRLHRFDGTSWHSEASPVAGPRALWGARHDDLWVGGDGGLARGQAAQWHVVKAVGGRVTAIAGRATDDVWVGGEQGLFHGSAP